MSIKFTRFIIRTILFTYTIGLICAVGLAIAGNDYTAKTIVCACGIVAFSLFFVGYYQTSWAFYGLLFVAIVTYGDLFKMNTIFGKKN